MAGESRYIFPGCIKIPSFQFPYLHYLGSTYDRTSLLINLMPNLVSRCVFHTLDRIFYDAPDVDAEADVGEQTGVAVDLLHGVESHLRPLDAVLLPAGGLH